MESHANNPHSLPLYLKHILLQYNKVKVCWIAYSGGMDSHVLLHMAVAIKNEINAKLIAVHVNHAISHNAMSWEQHCKRICQGYGVDLQSFVIDVSHNNMHGTEALARELRYEIFSKLMQPNDLLLTAHHMNDQIETVLLKLMRGSGPDGLSGIASCKLFATGHLLRPLLNFSRSILRDYALQESLQWVEDESNLLTIQDRNYLRNNVVPLLLKRWPSALKIVQRSAKHQLDYSNLINEISNHDLQTVCDGNDCTKINLLKFNDLSLIRQQHVLRAWFKKNKLSIPNAQLITTINKTVINAYIDRNPCVKWQGSEIRRYRNYLYLMQSSPKHDTKVVSLWSLQETLELGAGCLSAVHGQGNGIKRAMVSDGTVEIRYRQGGETIKPPGHEHAKRLKKLFQEIGLPPWLRDRVPLIFYSDQLIAVTDLCVAEHYAAKQLEPSWQIKWQPC